MEEKSALRRALSGISDIFKSASSMRFSKSKAAGLAIASVLLAAPLGATDWSPEEDPFAAPSTKTPKVTAAEAYNKANQIIVIDDSIDGYSAKKIKEKFLEFNESAPGKPITLQVKSYGGSVMEGRDILDAMDASASPVYTEIHGYCMSMCIAIAANGSPGHRTARPRAAFMIHEISAGTQGKLNVMETNVSWFGDMNTDIFSTVSDRSGLPLEALKVLAKEDTFLTAQEAQDLGIIDTVLYPTKVEIGYPLPKDSLPDWLCTRLHNLNPGCTGKPALPVPAPRPST